MCKGHNAQQLKKMRGQVHSFRSPEEKYAYRKKTKVVYFQFSCVESLFLRRIICIKMKLHYTK